MRLNICEWVVLLMIVAFISGGIMLLCSTIMTNALLGKADDYAAIPGSYEK